jgi:spore germination cell wall hydrolase CwlJ-like protein
MSEFWLSSPSQFAATLGVTEPVVRAWIARGRIKTQKIGRRIFIDTRPESLLVPSASKTKK